MPFFIPIKTYMINRDAIAYYERKGNTLMIFFIGGGAGLKIEMKDELEMTQAEILLFPNKP